MTKFVSVALCAAMVLFGASTASAQLCHDDSPHTRVEVAFSCDSGGTATCDETCVCARGYTARGTLDNGDPRCVRDPASYDICDERLGTVSNGRGGCRCTDENRAAGAIGTTPVAISSDDRREHGFRPLPAIARGCFRMAGSEMVPGPFGDWNVWRNGVDAYLAYLDAGLRASCGATTETTRPQVIEMCARARSGLAGVTPGAPDIVQRLTDIDTQLLAIEGALDAIRDRLDVIEPIVAAHTTELADHETRLDTIERTLRWIARSAYVRIGGFARFGGMLNGPLTGTGGVSAELLFRLGDLPVGFYGRFLFGGQSTGWNVGDSMYIGGGAGITLFTGRCNAESCDRDSTTFSLGWHADTLYDPYALAHTFDHDSLGILHAGILSVSGPLVGPLRIYAAIDVGLSERRAIDVQGIYHVWQDGGVAGTVGLEGQLPSIM